MKRIIAITLGVALMLSAVTTTALAQSRFDIKAIEVDKEIEEISYIKDDMRRFVTANKKYGFLNEYFDIIIPPVYEHAYDFELYTAGVIDGSDYCRIDRQGDITDYIYKTNFDENGIAVVSTSTAVGKKYAFINDKGELLTDFKYDELSEFYNGYAIAVIDDIPSAILVDESYNEIILEEYTEVLDILQSGNIVVRNKEGLVGIINQSFAEVTPFIYRSIHSDDIGDGSWLSSFGSPYVAQLQLDEMNFGNVGCIDGNGEIVVPFTYYHIFRAYSNGYIIAKPYSDSGEVLLNSSGEYICDTDFGYLIQPMLEEGKIVGYADAERGTYIGKYDIHIVSDYVDGVALAMKRVSDGDGEEDDLDELKYGLVDVYGNIVRDFDIPICDGEYPDYKGNPKYKSFLYGISDSMVAVRVDEKWGYMDLKGNMIIPPQYKSADDFVCGYAKVHYDGESFYIDKQGNRHDNLLVYGYKIDDELKPDEEVYVGTDYSVYLMSNPQFKRKDEVMQKGAYYMIQNNGQDLLLTDGITVLESRGNDLVNVDGNVVIENCCGEFESEFKFIGENELFVKTPDKNYVLQITREKVPQDVVLNIGEEFAVSDGQTMVPLRFVSESLGARVCYTDKTKLIAVTLGDKTFSHILGTDTAIVNGETITLKCPTYTQNDRTYIDLNSLAEALGLNVEWLKIGEQVKITA